MLATRISTGPSAASTSPGRAARRSRSEASATNGVAASPISAAASSSFSRERLAIATRAPSRASAAAIARPIPRLAPITSATRPSSPRSTLPPPPAHGRRGRRRARPRRAAPSQCRPTSTASTLTMPATQRRTSVSRRLSPTTRAVTQAQTARRRAGEPAPVLEEAVREDDRQQQRRAPPPPPAAPPPPARRPRISRAHSPIPPTAPPSRPACSIIRQAWAVSSVGRAPPLQGGGRWFEPVTAHLRSPMEQALELFEPQRRPHELDLEHGYLDLLGAARPRRERISRSG